MATLPNNSACFRSYICTFGRELQCNARMLLEAQETTVAFG